MKEKKQGLGQSEFSVQKESLLSLLNRENGDSIGAMLVVVGMELSRITPAIWTIRENETKPDTNRRQGEYSIPAETAKKGETKLETILGAIAEISDDQYFQELSRGLFLIDNLSHQEISKAINGHNLDLVLMAYTGSPRIPFEPINGEVSPFGWKTTEELVRFNGDLRFTLDILLKLEKERGVLTIFTDAFKDQKDMIIPFSQIIPEGLLIKDFYDQREKLQDVEVSAPIQVFPAK